MNRSCSTILYVMTCAALALTTPAAAQTWDGGGSNNNWTNGINWAGDVAPVNNGTANIIMAGSVRLTPTVDVAQSINSLTFNNTAGIFTIGGSALTIGGSGGITNNDIDTQTINSSIVLGAAQTWTANSGNLVVPGNISPSAAFDLFVTGANNTTLSGIVSGTIGFNKFSSGTGTLTLSGTSANTYTRDTAINGGTMVLSKTAGLNAIPGGIVTVGDFVGSTNSDVLRLGASNQIANAANMVVNSTGLFDLNGFSETVSGTLTMASGNITTGAGTFTVGGDVTTNASSATASISGNLAVSGQRTFTVNDGAAAIDLDIPATITGGGIIKAGAGRMRLGASNTFSTNFRIDAGTVDISDPGAFGTGTIQFNGGVITSNVLNQVVTNNLVIAGNVGLGTAADGNFNTDFSGNVTLSGGDRAITATGGGPGFSGSIGQDVAGRSLTLDGNSGMEFSGSSANTYTGTTTVNAGGLLLGKSVANGAIIGNLVIGDGTGTDSVTLLGGEQINDSSTVTINSSGQLSFGITLETETISNLVMSGGSVSFVNGTLVVTSGITTNANAATATISGLSLSLNNSTVPFTVADGAAAVDLDVSASVASGSVTKNGLGAMRFSGNTFNVYSGTTTVNAGTLILNKSGIAAGIFGPLVIGDGAGGANSDVVRLDASNQISTSVAPLITESGLLALNNVNQSLSGITLTGGNVTTGTGTLTLTGPVTSNASAQTAAISGKLSSSVDLVFSVANGTAATDLDVSAAISTSGVAGIVKNGAGTLKLSGTSTYAGATVLNLGIMEVSADANLGAAASTLTFNGGTLRTTTSFSINRPGVVQSGGGTIETLGLTTLTGSISGTGGLTKTGAGTLIVSSQSAQAGSLTVSAGSFELASGATLGITGATAVSSGTFVVIDNSSQFTSGSVANSGEIALGGTSATLATGTLTNSGVVHGRGRIDAVLSNQAAGEVRATSGDLLQFVNAGGSTNGGRINLLGGTVEFTQSALTNSATGQIIGNGTLDANSIANSGTMAFSGSANVLGNVTNSSGAKIISSGGGPTTFFDDVVNNGEIHTSPGGFTVFFGSVSGTGTFTGTGTVNMEGDLSPGASPATVSFAGNLAFGSTAALQMEFGGATPGTQFDQIHVAGALTLDGTLNVTLINAFAPQAGQSFDILDWTTLTGTFSALQLPSLTAGLSWNTSQLYTTGILSVATAGLPGDYNQNGTVDAADYVVWRKGLGTTFTQSDYDVWRAHFGQTAGSGSEASTLAGVPEPVTLAILSPVFAWLIVCTRRRVRATSTFNGRAR